MLLTFFSVKNGNVFHHTFENLSSQLTRSLASNNWAQQYMTPGSSRSILENGSFGSFSFLFFFFFFFLYKTVENLTSCKLMALSGAEKVDPKYIFRTKNF